MYCHAIAMHWRRVLQGRTDKVGEAYYRAQAGIGLLWTTGAAAAA
jgi:hypothetical protein